MSGLDSNAIAMRGMSWIMLNTIVGRAVVFGAQIVLGWLLSPRDFGMYALALSISNALASIRNGGTSELLRQQGSRYTQIVSALTQYSLLFNVGALAILVAIAPFTGTRFHSAELPWLIVCIGISFPLGTLANTYRCKLAIDHRFRDLAVLSTWSTVLWQVEVVVLALLGCGPFSYVVPMVLQGVFEGAMGWYYLRDWPIRGERLCWLQVVTLFKETRWVMVGAAMLSLGLTGHYFVVGLISDPQTVGLFFFGFQLVTMVFAILNNAVENVLPAMLAHLNGHPSRQAAMGLDMLKLLLVITFPLSGTIAVAAPIAIHLIWHGKWDASAGMVGIMAFCIPAWMIIAVVRAVFEARGMWKHRVLLLTAYGVGGIVAAALGALSGDLRILGTYITGYYVLLAVVLAMTLPQVMCSSRQAVGNAVLPPALSCGLCLLAAVIAVEPLPVTTSALVRSLAEIATFATAAAIINAFFFRATWVSAAAVWNHR